MEKTVSCPPGRVNRTRPIRPVSTFGVDIRPGGREHLKSLFLHLSLCRSARTSTVASSGRFRRRKPAVCGGEESFFVPGAAARNKRGLCTNSRVSSKFESYVVVCEPKDRIPSYTKGFAELRHTPICVFLLSFCEPKAAKKALAKASRSRNIGETHLLDPQAFTVVAPDLAILGVQPDLTLGLFAPPSSGTPKPKS